jgi:hypothetical protein
MYTTARMTNCAKALLLSISDTFVQPFADWLTVGGKCYVAPYSGADVTGGSWRMDRRINGRNHYRGIAVDITAATDPAVNAARKQTGTVLTCAQGLPLRRAYLMFCQTIAASWSIVSMPYCSFGFPVVSTAIR